MNHQLQCYSFLPRFHLHLFVVIYRRYLRLQHNAVVFSQLLWPTFPLKKYLSSLCVWGHIHREVSSQTLYVPLTFESTDHAWSSNKKYGHGEYKEKFPFSTVAPSTIKAAEFVLSKVLRALRSVQNFTYIRAEISMEKWLNVISNRNILQIRTWFWQWLL